MPSYAKLIKTVIRDVMIPIFCLSCFEIVGDIKVNSSVVIS